LERKPNIATNFKSIGHNTLTRTKGWILAAVAATVLAVLSPSVFKRKTYGFASLARQVAPCARLRYPLYLRDEFTHSRCSGFDFTRRKLPGVLSLNFYIDLHDSFTPTTADGAAVTGITTKGNILKVYDSPSTPRLRL
jgi:hypothetical protein